jgi:hypothetical protein
MSIVDGLREFSGHCFYWKRKWIFKKALSVTPIGSNKDFKLLLERISYFQSNLKFIDYLNEGADGSEILIKSAIMELYGDGKKIDDADVDYLSIMNLCQDYFDGKRDIPSASDKKKVEEKVDRSALRHDRDPARLKDAVSSGPIKFSMRDRK